MSLSITNYTTPFSETQSKNGLKKTVHYIVKNTPFELKIRIPQELINSHSFKTGVIECKLLLDQSGFKEVDYSVKSKPLEYEILMNDGRECVIRFKVKVLSTYFEKSLFVISIKLNNGDKTIECSTDSFKSVSKQTQIQKKITEVKGFSQKLENNPVGVKPKGNKKKRTKTDELLEMLETIKGEQQQQSEILKTIMKGDGGLKDNVNNQVDTKEPAMSDEEYFQHCLLKLMDSYQKLGNDRPLKMKRVLESNPVLSNDSVQMLYEIQKEVTHTHPGDCPNLNCPYREHIFQMNTLYTDMLNEPYPLEYDTTLVGL